MSYMHMCAKGRPCEHLAEGVRHHATRGFLALVRDFFRFRRGVLTQSVGRWDLAYPVALVGRRRVGQREVSGLEAGCLPLEGVRRHHVIVIV